jgi:transposase
MPICAPNTALTKPKLFKNLEPIHAPRLQMAELEALVLDRPDPATDGVVRWRWADVREQVQRRFAVTVHERTIGKWLRRRDLTRLQPRPAHPRQDLAAQETFKPTSPS